MPKIKLNKIKLKIDIIIEKLKMNKTVLIYNPISGVGHLDSWLIIFMTELLKYNWKIVVLTPQKEIINNEKLRKIKNKENLIILEWNIKDEKFKNSVSKGTIFRGIEYFKELLNKFIKLNRLMAVSIYYRIVYTIIIKNEKWETKKNISQVVLDYYINETNENSYSIIEYYLKIIKGLNKHKIKPDVIINMYMDTYNSNSDEWKMKEWRNLPPQIGIKFRPMDSPSEKYLEINNFKGLFLLEEDKIENYKKKYEKKFFFYLPDTTDRSIITKESKLVNEIIQKANGRKIIFLGGLIGANKNLLKWIELIYKSNSKKYFFIQVGELDYHTLLKVEIDKMNEIKNKKLENLFVYDKYIQKEEEFNSILNISDIIFAVYKNFKSSSNILTKASIFKNIVNT